MFTARNAVVLAITQVAVIVFGTLAAAVSGKIWTVKGIELPPVTFLLLNFGIVLFAVPLGWISVAMTIRQRPWISDEIKHLTFLAGFALLLGLFLFEAYALLSPWLYVFEAGFGSKVNLDE